VLLHRPMASQHPSETSKPHSKNNSAALSLVRGIGAFDLTMIVMGGIIGSGIFMNPSVVARILHTPFLILMVWGIGGLVALIGAFIYAELAARRPNVGGQYAYLRDGFHPAVGFLYGWTLLLVIQTGGMAAVSLTFARYFQEFVVPQIPGWLIATLVLAILTLINCLGVRAGSRVQSILMVLKIAAIATLILCGLFLGASSPDFGFDPLLDRPVSFDLLTAIGAGMVPVLFAYGGWQTANFVAGEVRDPQRMLPRGLVIGVTGVVILYLAVNYVCLKVLGTAGLAANSAPASAVMRIVLGQTGARLIAAGIAISTLGFLSQSMLTAPRVYFAMAQDNVFFKSVARIHPRSRVPVAAICLQGALAILIALSSRYEQILNYVVCGDFIFFGLTALCVFLFRRNESHTNVDVPKIPGHPVTTLLFIAVSWLVVLNTIYRYPQNTLIGILIILTGFPVYYYWKRRRAL
jgi:basic amino acid/polyamine antiporter, APA family